MIKKKGSGWSRKELLKMYGRGYSKHWKGHVPPARWKGKKNKRG